MIVALLVNTFNSLTQAIYVRLKDKNHKPYVVYAINEKQMIDEIATINPDIILSPFLTKYIPSCIYQTYPTFIFHPGPKGDRGANALEYAIKQKVKKWGVTILKADKDYDGGDIYAEVSFDMRDTYKASLYRNEVKQAFLKALDIFFVNFQNNHKTKQILNPLHKPFSNDEKSINWQKDSTDLIIRKINMFDSHPGLLDEIQGIKCYLYGAHKEERLKGDPKEIIAKRDGAICLGTIDGAVWVSHLKEPNRFKLPSTYVLKDKLKGIKENRLPLIFDRSYKTFYEISIDEKDEVVYLYFNFHNGAMSSHQCIRLKYAIEYLAAKCKVLVLMGGVDFFSNGIHLNILEDSKKEGEDGWANINAMNDLIKSIIFLEDVVTIASFEKNAGAGGVFLGLACDFVVASDSVVLNPHYKTLGLSGSEYHTYTFYKRVGEQKAKYLLDKALPISSKEALDIGMVDAVFDAKNYKNSLHSFCLSKIDDDFLWEKQEYLYENKDYIESCKEKELKIMYNQFWDENSAFHKLRKEFVYKICPTKTPKRFRYA